jgi:hypothetical protein
MAESSSQKLNPLRGSQWSGRHRGRPLPQESQRGTYQPTLSCGRGRPLWRPDHSSFCYCLLSALSHFSLRNWFGNAADMSVSKRKNHTQNCKKYQFGIG